MPFPRTCRGLRRAALACLALATACGGDGPVEPTQPTQLRLAIAPPTATTSGAALTPQPVIQIADAAGNAVAASGTLITASLDQGTVLGAVTATTGPDGRATFSDLAVSGLAGERQLSFSAPGLTSATHRITIVAGTAVALAPASATIQSWGVSRPVPVVPLVRVTDASDNPVAGTDVTFTVVSGGGTVQFGTARTSGNGTASAGTWTLGAQPGENRLRATVPGVAQGVEFLAHGTLVVPASIVIAEGNNQVAIPLATLPVRPAVRILDQDGNPAAGIAVQFAVRDGGGSITDAMQISDAEGIARVGSWTLGPGAVANHLEAHVPGVPGSPKVFIATGSGIGNLYHVIGDGQRAEVGHPVAEAPGVQVLDHQGNPLAGVTVTFSVVEGGGTVTGATQVTAASGIARVGSWTLGATAGTNRLHASAPNVGYSPLVFTATALTVVPARMQLHAGNGQTGRVNTALPVAPAVLVTGADGRPAPDQVVRFLAQQGSVGQVTAVSGADGIASAGSWILSTIAGAHELVAEAEGLLGNPVVFHAVATAGTPARLVAEVEEIGSGVVGRPVADPGRYSVLVQDQYGNRVPGVTVTFSVASGSVSGAVKTTSSIGQAAPDAWILGPVAGTQTLTAVAVGLPPLGLPIDAVAGPPATLTVAQGDGQTAGTGRILPLELGVRYQDEYGNPVRNQGVTIALPDGGEILDVRPSGADGVAHFRWRLGPVAGTQRITASHPDAPGETVDFTATATAIVSEFDIDLRYLSTLTAAEQAAFTAASARWTGIVLADLPAWELNLPRQACFLSQPALSEEVDDVLIFVEIVPIDGPGGILGAAGPCVLRQGSLLPVMGLMRFDRDDLSSLTATGELGDVILHEMAHVMGFGVLWSERGLVAGPGSPNPTFTGSAARSAYEAIGGSGGVPIESQGGAGTALVHWRESVFRTELMTGFIGAPPNPLSTVTIGSLQDLGYVVDYGGADPIGFAISMKQEGQAQLRQLREVLLDGPMFVTNPDGNVLERRQR